MSSTSDRSKAGARINVHLPSALEPTYANLALLTHSASEIILDFGQMMPKAPRAEVKARIVMTPTNAKLLLKALTTHLSRFEEQHGEIKVSQSSSLADQLFRPADGDPEDGEEGDGDE